MLFRRLSILLALILVAVFAGLLPAHDHHAADADCHVCCTHDGASVMEVCSCPPTEHPPGQHVPTHRGHSHKHDCAHCNACQLAKALTFVAPTQPCLCTPNVTRSKPWLSPQRVQSFPFLPTFDLRGPPAA